MSIAVTYNSQASIVETLEGEYISPGDPTVTTNGLNTTAGLTASTTPPVTKYSAFQKALSTGTGTIDLTSLTGANGATVATRADYTLTVRRLKRGSSSLLIHGVVRGN